MNNEMYVVICQSKINGDVWICNDESEFENQVFNKESAEKLFNIFKQQSPAHNQNCNYRIAKLSWLD